MSPEARGPRPVWVYAVVAVYALLLGGLALVPFVLPLTNGDGAYPALCVTVTVLVVCEAALLFVPVRAASRRPLTRRALWIPLLGSGLLAGVLVLGAGLALVEFAGGSENFPAVPLELILAAAAAVWLGWAVVFWLVSRRRGPETVGARLHRWLLGGSVLELLVAVPTHVVVRRRTECCAGIATGMGICAGVVVMLLAFGPSVAFLYYRRWNQIRNR